MILFWYGPPVSYFHMSTLGKKMNADIEVFDELVVHLNYRWKLHKDLFQGSAYQCELFNESGSNVWVALRESLLDAIFMDISRLLDPTKSFGKDNLSIERLLPMAAKKKPVKILDTEFLEIKELYQRLIRPWRNQRLSHNDINTLSGQTGLPDVTFSEIDELITKINDVASSIVWSETNMCQDFVPEVTPTAWTQRLFSVLLNGVAQLPPEIRRKGSGDNEDANAWH